MNFCNFKGEWSIEGQKDVFLGGSCGQEKSWRDGPMRFFNEHKISFYNPDYGFGGWKEEFVAIERDAKDEAAVLMFVISSDTRGIASMIETAES